MEETGGLFVIGWKFDVQSHLQTCVCCLVTILLCDTCGRDCKLLQKKFPQMHASVTCFLHQGTKPLNVSIEIFRTWFLLAIKWCENILWNFIMWFLYNVIKLMRQSWKWPSSLNVCSCYFSELDASFWTYKILQVLSQKNMQVASKRQVLHLKLFTQVDCLLGAQSC